MNTNLEYQPFLGAGYVETLPGKPPKPSKTAKPKKRREPIGFRTGAKRDSTD